MSAAVLSPPSRKRAWEGDCDELVAGALLQAPKRRGDSRQPDLAAWVAHTAARLSMSEADVRDALAHTGNDLDAALRRLDALSLTHGGGVAAEEPARAGQQAAALDAAWPASSPPAPATVTPVAPTFPLPATADGWVDVVVQACVAALAPVPAAQPPFRRSWRPPPTWTTRAHEPRACWARSRARSRRDSVGAVSLAAASPGAGAHRPPGTRWPGQRPAQARRGHPKRETAGGGGRGGS